MKNYRKLTDSQARLLSVASADWQTTRHYTELGFQLQTLRILRQHGLLEYRVRQSAEGRWVEWRKVENSNGR